MKILNNKFLQYMTFSMAGGLVSSLLAIIGCCMLFLFFLIPMMPIVFIGSWLIGGFLGWTVSKNEKKLPFNTYILSVFVFSILSFLILHFWLYSNSLRYCIGYVFLSSIGFAISSIPAIIYIKKIIVPELFIPPVPRNRNDM